MEGIFEVWNDTDQRAALISRGLERVRQFSWQEAVRQTLVVYRQVASEVGERITPKCH